MAVGSASTKLPIALVVPPVAAMVEAADTVEAMAANSSKVAEVRLIHYILLTLADLPCRLRPRSR